MSGRRPNCCPSAFRLISWIHCPLWSVFIHRLRKLITAVEGHYLILRRVKNFEQGRCRITTKITPQLVDLIEHKHRVVGLRTPERLQNPPRERANVGASMPAQLGFV